MPEDPMKTHNGKTSMRNEREVARFLGSDSLVRGGVQITWHIQSDLKCVSAGMFGQNVRLVK